MIDGFNACLKGNAAKHTANLSHLDGWTRTTSKSTGEELELELRYPLTKDDSIYFRYFPNSNILYVRGSLTIYQLGNNYENMRCSKLREAVYSLCDWLQFHPNQTHSFLFEYGVTTTLPYSPDLLLSNMMFASKKPYKYSESQGYCESNLVGRQASLKNYNKSTQYNSTASRAEQLHNLNIFRTEVKLDKGQPVHEMGIYTLQDLLSKDNLAQLQNDHCKRIARTFVHDWRLDSTQMSKKELANYHNWSQRGFWQKIVKQPNSYKYQKELAEAFYKTHNPEPSIAKQLTNQIKNEWQTCLNS